MPTPFLETPAPEPAQPLRVGQLYGSSRSLFLCEQVEAHPGLSVIVCCDMTDAEQLEQEIRFFSREAPRIYRFPDLETLPYDQFSPHQDIISERIRCLASISKASDGILILPVSTLLQKISPPEFIHQRSLNLQPGDRVAMTALREDLGRYGYRAVAQVEEHGEFSVRGSLLDLFPMGSSNPFRIDFFDDEVETIRSFDVETQKSVAKIDAIRLLPAQEYPLDDPGIKRFRLRFRETFDIDPNTCPVYVDISEGIASPGVEYYLPLFFDGLVSLFDYLPQNCRLLIDDSAETHAASFIEQVDQRYESRRYNLEWPLLPPQELFLDLDSLRAQLQSLALPLFQRLQTRYGRFVQHQQRLAVDSATNPAAERRKSGQTAARIHRTGQPSARYCSAQSPPAGANSSMKSCASTRFTPARWKAGKSSANAMINAIT